MLLEFLLLICLSFYLLFSIQMICLIAPMLGKTSSRSQKRDEFWKGSGNCHY